MQHWDINFCAGMKDIIVRLQYFLFFQRFHLHVLMYWSVWKCLKCNIYLAIKLQMKYFGVSLILSHMYYLSVHLFFNLHALCTCNLIEEVHVYIMLLTCVNTKRFISKSGILVKTNTSTRNFYNLSWQRMITIELKNLDKKNFKMFIPVALMEISFKRDITAYHIILGEESYDYFK